MTIREFKKISMVNIEEVVIESKDNYENFKYDDLIAKYGLAFKDMYEVVEFEPIIMTGRTGGDELNLYTSLRVYVQAIER